MKTSNSAAQRRPEAPPDSTLVERIGAGDQPAFEALMRKYNGKLFRIARAILKDDSDAEDVLHWINKDPFPHTVTSKPAISSLSRFSLASRGLTKFSSSPETFLTPVHSIRR